MLTLVQISHRFDKLNKEFFNGELEKPQFKFKRVRKFLGQYSVKPTPTICLSTAWEMTDLEVEKVLIHEMVHAWQHHCHFRLGHNKTFYAKAYQINSATNNKYEIARKSKLKNETCLKPQNKKSPNGYFMVYKSSGKEVFAKFESKKCLDNVLSWATTHERISDIRVYNAQVDKTPFTSMICSKKILHGYLTTDKFAGYKDAITSEYKFSA